MDRSFLLRKEVIEASRDFVCIRLATYEDKEEVEYLTQVFRGSAGTLENTVFTMLSPDAHKYLARSGRGPQHAFYDSADMAKQMKTFAAAYKPTDAQKALPAMKDFRLALNVAAADNMPLVVAVADSHDDRAALNEKLADMAWSKELLGKYHYARACSTADLAAAKINTKPGIYVVEPDVYGQSGKVLATVETGSLESGLKTALAKFKPPVKEAQTHIAEGVRKGVKWQTATPVTDPHDPEAGRR